MRKSLLQYAGLLAVSMALVSYFFLSNKDQWMALGTACLMLAANALDELAPQSNKEDILEFKRHLKQSWTPLHKNNNDADSDSSESYDMERHGGK